MTLADHAEVWAHKNNVPIPTDKESAEWQYMYEKWIDYAFSDFQEEMEE